MNPRTLLLRCAFVLAVSGLAGLACGEWFNAPYQAPAEGRGAGKCGTTQEIKATLRASATRADFQPLAELVRVRLVETGRYRQVVRLALGLFRELPPPAGLPSALDSLRRGEGLARLTPNLRAMLWYVIGSAKLPLAPGEEFARGEHYGPVAVVADTMRVCQPQTTLRVLQALLTVRIPCATCPSGERMVAAALADALSAVLEDPELGGNMDAVQFSDSETSEHAIGRRAFALFVDMFMEGLSSASFNAQYFDDNLRPLVNDVLGRRLSDPARQNLTALLDTLDLALAPELDLLRPLQDTVACMRRLDADHEIAGMFFDYVRLESMQSREALDALAGVFESESGAVLNAYVAEVLGAVAADPSRARDVMASLFPLLADGAERQLLTALDGLQGKGVANGALDLAARFLARCAALGE